MAVAEFSWVRVEPVEPIQTLLVRKILGLIRNANTFLTSEEKKKRNRTDLSYLSFSAKSRSLEALAHFSLVSRGVFFPFPLSVATAKIKKRDSEKVRLFNISHVFSITKLKPNEVV